MQSMIGKTIGRYRLVELLGRGGMAEVYKAYQASLDRYVAIKLMHTFLAEDTDFFNRFNREARNIAALRHPHIIQIHDFDHEGDTYYMVMEFIDGGTLKDRLEELAVERQRLPLNEVVGIVRDVGSALAYSHRLGMIHRDVKPANVLLESSGRVVLTDFGIAKMLSGGKFTASGSVLGTPSYMAPEQGLGQPGDARADIYSLGVLFYQLATGRVPYEADTPIAIILKHVNEPLPPPRSLNPALPEAAERVIMKAMAKDPAERYQVVDEYLADLNELGAAAQTEVPSSAAGRKGEPTVRAVPDKRGGATVIGGRTVLAAAGSTAAVPVKKAVNLVPLLLGGLAVLFVVGVAGAAFLGPRIVAGLRPSETPAPTSTTTPVPRPTDTPAPVGTPTIDPIVLDITRQAATLAALLATPVGTPTPDRTATYVACSFDAGVAGQDPKDGASIPVDKETTLTLEVENKGGCAWDQGTVIAFLDGDDMHDASNATSPVPAARPGDRVEVTIPITLDQARQYSATWQIRLADGREVGPPIKLTYRGYVPATAGPRPTAAPLPTNTAAATPTRAGGPITGANPTFFSCTYIANTTDYECLTNIGVGGGVPPFTITIDGRGDQTGVQTPDKPYFFQLRGRRCIDRIFTYRVVDSAGNVFDGSGTFYPMTSKLFNNNTEVCGLG